MNLRNTLIQRWQSGKGGVRFCLIPVSDGKEIVRPMIGMPVLNRGAQRFGKSDWRIQVKAIDRCPASRLFASLNRRARQYVGEWMVAKAPRSQKIIFRAGAIDGRRCFSI